MPELVSYITVLLRAIEGIRVVDSVAWARVASSGEVVAEEVYWPAVPAAVVQTAKLMKARLENPSTSAGLLAQLGASAASLEDVEVVIRHSGSTVDAAPTFHASYDVRVRAGDTSYHRHLDDQLREFKLAHEQPTTVPAHLDMPKLNP